MSRTLNRVAVLLGTLLLLAGGHTAAHAASASASARRAEFLQAQDERRLRMEHLAAVRELEIEARSSRTVQRVQSETPAASRCEKSAGHAEAAKTRS